MSARLELDRPRDGLPEQQQEGEGAECGDDAERLGQQVEAALELGRLQVLGRELEVTTSCEPLDLTLEGGHVARSPAQPQLHRVARRGQRHLTSAVPPVERRRHRDERDGSL